MILSYCYKLYDIKWKYDGYIEYRSFHHDLSSSLHCSIHICIIHNSILNFKKKYNIDPRATTRNDKILYFLQIYRNLIFIFILITIIIFSFLPRLYPYLVPIHYLEINPLRYAGMFLMLLSLICVKVSQIQLKSSWRMGIDRTKRKTELITRGLYKWSRNPIAFGMIMSATGLFLTIPNVFTFTILNLVYLIFSTRIRIEEEHLSKMHGEEYDNYKKRTRRWL